MDEQPEAGRCLCSTLENEPWNQLQPVSGTALISSALVQGGEAGRWWSAGDLELLNLLSGLGQSQRAPEGWS